MQTFEQWKDDLATELSKLLNVDGADYIRGTGDDCWREMFEDGLSPADAAGEEYIAACQAQ